MEVMRRLAALRRLAVEKAVDARENVGAARRRRMACDARDADPQSSRNTGVSIGKAWDIAPSRAAALEQRMIGGRMPDAADRRHERIQDAGLGGLC